MRLFPRRSHLSALPGISGPARPPRLHHLRPGHFDPSGTTRAIARRAEPGDILVLDQIDLDRVSAEAVVAARPAAVVNVRPSISGRHPARGANVVLAAGIPLLDDVGPGLLSELRDGQEIRIDDGKVYAGDRLLGSGDRLTPQLVSNSEDRARTGMISRLDSVGADAAAFLRTYEGLLLEGDGLPDPGLPLAGRQVLVVGPGERAAAQLHPLRGWVRECRPVIIAADGGGSAVRKAGLRLDVLIGEPGDLTPRDLSRSRHVPPSDVPDGFSAADFAVVMAAHGDARLIVLAGAPASYDELLDRDRESAAALLAVRLCAGDRLVDAAAVARLHRPAVGLLGAWSVVAAGAVAVAVALASVPGSHALLDHLRQALPW